MKVLLSKKDQEQAFRDYVFSLLADVTSDGEMEVRFPAYIGDDVTVTIVKKPPQELPQE